MDTPTTAKRIEPIAIQSLANEWRRVGHVLVKALNKDKYPTHKEADILDELITGDLQLFTNGESAVITEMNKYPQAKVLSYFLVGGKLEELFELEKEIEQFAKQNGCNRVQGNGRLGWEKVLKDYEKTTIVMVKEIR